MANSTIEPKPESIERVASVYKKTESISETARQTELSTTKVRKILITEGLWSSPRSEQIRDLVDQGKTPSEIAEMLGITAVMVQNYLPYEKGLYDEPDKTDTAIRSEKYRERNRSYAQKTQGREQQKLEGLGTGEEHAPSSEKKQPLFAMHLHLELRDSRLDAMNPDEAKILAKYGAVKKSISRDVIVPSSLALHQLHYLINVAFGWTNSHLHNFQLPQPMFDTLTSGKFVEIAPVYGYYLQFPNTTFNDAFWDDDYDESKSPRTWMRSKYLKQYRYEGLSEYWIENQAEILDMAKHLPILDVDPLSRPKQAIPKKVKFEDATLQDLLTAIVFDSGMPDGLKESRRLSEILSLDPISIESAKAAALKTDTSSVSLYKQYRDIFVTEAQREDSSHNDAAYSRAFRQIESLQKETEPRTVKPITTELVYTYDFGDGWQVDITLVEEFGRDNQRVDDETAANVIATRKPVCIAKDGLNVLDDCGNVWGYIDMLHTIHEEDKEEAIQMRTWARSQGWTGRDMSPKQIL